MNAAKAKPESITPDQKAQPVQNEIDIYRKYIGKMQPMIKRSTNLRIWAIVNLFCSVFSFVLALSLFRSDIIITDTIMLKILAIIVVIGVISIIVMISVFVAYFIVIEIFYNEMFEQIKNINKN